MIVVNQRLCPQNHPCPAMATCPQGAIVQDSIMSAPRIEHDQCTECGVCTATCRVFQHVAEEATVAASSLSV
jgi:ferredoxin